MLTNECYLAVELGLGLVSGWFSGYAHVYTGWPKKVSHYD